MINNHLRKPFAHHLPRKKTFDMTEHYSTDSATISALISFNKQISRQLTITFNGLSYVVPHMTMCICSTLVKEMTSDTEGLVEPIELSCEHVSKTSFETLLPFFQTGFIPNEWLYYDSFRVLEGFLLADYLQSQALHSFCECQLIVKYSDVISSKLFHHTTLPFRLFGHFLVPRQWSGHEAENEFLLEMWTEYTDKNKCPGKVHVCDSWRPLLAQISLNIDPKKVVNAKKRMPKEVFDALSPLGLLESVLKSRNLRHLLEAEHEVPSSEAIYEI